MQGGKLKMQTLQSIIKGGYKKKTGDQAQNIDGYELDRDLSGRRAQVYHNPQTGKTVINHRGTSGFADARNNLRYLTGDYEKTKRYQHGKKIQEQAQQKYGDSDISTIGHSQGAVLAHKLGKDSKEIITLNGASRGERQHANEYSVRSDGDVVSAFQPKSQNTTTIKSRNRADVLGNHSSDILDGRDEEIGAGLRKVNPWVAHVLQYSKSHKVSYGDALTRASKSYKRKN